MAGKNEKEISPKNFPNAVKAAIEKIAPKAEIELNEDGKESELTLLIDQFGKLIKK